MCELLRLQLVDAAVPGFAPSTLRACLHAWVTHSGCPLVSNTRGPAGGGLLSSSAASRATRRQQRLTVTMWESSFTLTPLFFDKGNIGMPGRLTRAFRHLRARRFPGVKSALEEKSGTVSTFSRGARLLGPRGGGPGAPGAPRVGCGGSGRALGTRAPGPRGAWIRSELLPVDLLFGRDDHQLLDVGRVETRRRPAHVSPWDVPWLLGRSLLVWVAWAWSTSSLGVDFRRASSPRRVGTPY